MPGKNCECGDRIVWQSFHLWRQLREQQGALLGELAIPA